ncbi:hypothetical protein EYS42_16625 [Aquabacterium lacunae]|uniref:Uncharacterized protein n=1 Tax=Aquabacterium lacunae TaxID=2528630 RepID=A0A4Q9GUF2_9BURK|nr:hypothetical protein [Aquabacterium lacunae]TBO27592.1 hypothetical protein EYS42_16625 [Aquabacterium lacunae]
MSETEILSYVGAITGVIGALTGIAGSIMGYLSYRKSNEVKALELRLELTKLGQDTFFKAEGLGELMARAKRSREAVSAAMGMRKSGAMVQWRQQYAADEESLSGINESVDELNIDYSSADLKAIEKALGEVHGLRSIVIAIADRYTASIEEDDRNREFLRDQAHARHNQKL